jgi:hypothetical protein
MRNWRCCLATAAPGIEDNLLAAIMKPQCCQWHAKRDFPYLLYADGFKKATQQPLIEKLQSVPAMTLTQADMEKLRPEDRPLLLVEQMMEKTQQGFEQLLQALDPPNATPHTNLHPKSHGAGHHVPQALVGQRGGHTADD